MSERTAAQILIAQLEHEVAEAKAEFYVPEDADKVEKLALKVTRLWWLKRLYQEPPKDIDPEEGNRRRDVRIQTLFAAASRIDSRMGKQTVEPLKTFADVVAEVEHLRTDTMTHQLSSLGFAAELNAIWRLLIESALTTPAQRMDLLDGGALDLYNRVMAESQKIQMGAPGNGIARPS